MLVETKHTKLLNKEVYLSIKRSLVIILGTIFQWFDFALFGAVSSKLATTFYPSTIPHSVSVMMLWLSFAVAWLLAPVGGIIFGYIGDTYSRKSALVLSILLMSSASLIIAVLPSYHAIGILAPILLLVSRLLQGLSTNGEYTSAVVTLIEQSSKKLSYLAGALCSVACSLGMMFGYFIGAIAVRHDMPNWAWRIPFFMAFIGLLCSYYLRKNAKITYVKKNISLWAFIKKGKAQRHYFFKKSNLSMILGAYFGVVAWTISIWLSSFLQYYGLSASQAASIIFISFALDIIIQPIVAIFAQKINARKIFMFFAILLFIIFYPCLKLFAFGNFHLALLAILMIRLCVSPTMSVLDSLSIYYVHKKFRCSMRGFFILTGMTIFGGTAPLILSSFMHFSKHYSIVFIAAYVCFFILLGIIGIKNYDRF